MANETRRWIILYVTLAGMWLGFQSSGATAADSTVAMQKKKIDAEATKKLKRIPLAKEAELEQIADRLKELSDDGLPIRRRLCEMLATQDGAVAKKTLLVLTKVAPELAVNVESLTAAPSKTSSPSDIFQNSLDRLGDLSRDRQIDPAMSPLVKALLLNLAKLEAAVSSNRSTEIDSDLSRKAYDSGIAVIVRMAQTDDGAFGDLLSLTELGIKEKYVGGEFVIYLIAGDKLSGTAKGNPDRIKAALGVLSADLRRNLAISQMPEGPGVLGVTVRFNAMSGVTRALERIRGFDTDAKALIPLVRQVSNDSRFQREANETLSRIGG